jgi:bacterioferritin-associated ferredoxin
MSPDEELCLCFHVSWRKVINYARIHQVKLPSQLAECGGAGTGCGWCRGAMVRIISRMQTKAPDATEIERWLREDFPAHSDYKQNRSDYIKASERQADASRQAPPEPESDASRE